MLHTYWKYPKHYWSGFEEESSVCSICSPIFLPTFIATFSISWAKSRLDGSQEEQNGVKQGRGTPFSPTFTTLKVRRKVGLQMLRAARVH